MKGRLRIAWALPVLALGLVFALPARAGDDPAQALYKKHCQICHAKDGSGQTKQGEKTKTVDWRDGETWKKVDDATAKQIILEGKGKMKGYKEKVPADQVDALLAYCKGLSQPADAAAPASEAAAPAEAPPAAE